jgi:hypothetical protein
MAKPAQGDVGLLEDPRAQALLEARGAAHLAYTWSDGTPRNTPIWFHWNGEAVVMCGLSTAPRVRVLTDGAPVAVTIHSDDWPYAALLLRGPIATHQTEGIPTEYRRMAERYFGEEQGAAWCDQLPQSVSMTCFTLRPAWVGLIDFEGMRRLPSAIAG